MTGYVKEALHNFQHLTPIQYQNSPHQCNPPKYGSTSPHMAHQSPESPKLAPPESNTVQKVVGTFLYYLRAVDPTMLVASNSISIKQTNSTETTTKAVNQMLNYAATHSEYITRYHANTSTLPPLTILLLLLFLNLTQQPQHASMPILLLKIPLYLI